MINTSPFRWVLPILLWCLSPLTLALAADLEADALQTYRNAISQAERVGAQNVLGQLPSPPPSSNSPNRSDSQSTQTLPQAAAPAPQTKSGDLPTPLSGNPNAVPPPSYPKPTPNVTAPNRAQGPSTTAPSRNPWVVPNPWEAQSKVNPWANAPIPGPHPTAPPPPPPGTTPNHSTSGSGDSVASPPPPAATNGLMQNYTAPLQQGPPNIFSPSDSTLRPPPGTAAVPPSTPIPPPSIFNKAPNAITNSNNTAIYP